MNAIQYDGAPRVKTQSNYSLSLRAGKDSILNLSIRLKPTQFEHKNEMQCIHLMVKRINI